MLWREVGAHPERRKIWIEGCEVAPPDWKETCTFSLEKNRIIIVARSLCWTGQMRSSGAFHLSLEPIAMLCFTVGWSVDGGRFGPITEEIYTRRRICFYPGFIILFKLEGSAGWLFVKLVVDDLMDDELDRLNSIKWTICLKHRSASTSLDPQTKMCIKKRIY